MPNKLGKAAYAIITPVDEVKLLTKKRRKKVKKPKKPKKKPKKNTRKRK